MYYKAWVLLLIFLLAILEVSFFSNFFPRSIAPNVVLTLIVIWSFQKSFEQLWIWAILAGFILDALMFLPFGVNAISFLVISFGIGFVTKRFFVTQKTKSFFIIGSLILGATIINYTLRTLIISLIGYSFESGMFIFSSLFQFQNLSLQVFVNLIIFSLMYWPIVLKNKLALK